MCDELQAAAVTQLGAERDGFHRLTGDHLELWALGCALELRAGSVEDELRALAEEGVQSLLLEGGPTLATAFLTAGLVDKLLLFVAPVIAGSGPRFLGDLDEPVTLHRLEAERLGQDLFLSGYVHEP